MTPEYVCFCGHEMMDHEPVDSLGAEDIPCGLCECMAFVDRVEGFA